MMDALGRAYQNAATEENLFRLGSHDAASGAGTQAGTEAGRGSGASGDERA